MTGYCGDFRPDERGFCRTCHCTKGHAIHSARSSFRHLYLPCRDGRTTDSCRDCGCTEKHGIHIKMDEICSDFHNCHRCGGLTPLETFKQTCPWVDSDIEREGLDGAMCATCMDEGMQALAKN